MTNREKSRAYALGKQVPLEQKKPTISKRRGKKREGEIGGGKRKQREKNLSDRVLVFVPLSEGEKRRSHCRRAKSRRATRMFSGERRHLPYQEGGGDLYLVACKQEGEKDLEIQEEKGPGKSAGEEEGVP